MTLKVLKSFRQNCLWLQFFSQICSMGLNGDSPRWGLLRAAIGYHLLQLQRTSTNEAKGRANRGGAIHNPVPQHSQRVSIVESNMSFIKVQAHAEAWGQGGCERATHTIRCPGFGHEDLPHAHGEEAEWRRTVLSIFCSTVMPTVRIISDKKEKGSRECLILKVYTVCVAETITCFIYKYRLGQK